METTDISFSSPFSSTHTWIVVGIYNLNFIRTNELRFMVGLNHVKALFQPKSLCDSKIKEAVIEIEYYKTEKQNLMMFTNKKKILIIKFC